MKLTRKYFFLIPILMSVISCTPKKSLFVNVVETSKSGHKLTSITSFNKLENISSVVINPEKKYQTMLINLIETR